MTFKIPDKITVNGMEIPTIYDPHLLVDSEHQGEYHSRLVTITLDKTLSEQKQKYDYIHELHEVAKDLYGLDLSQQDIWALTAFWYQIIEKGQLKEKN